VKGYSRRIKRMDLETEKEALNLARCLLAWEFLTGPTAEMIRDL